VLVISGSVLVDIIRVEREMAFELERTFQTYDADDLR
jgi:hypothetical protein